MNIIVTGANGFIGRWLITELVKQDEYQITALIRRGGIRTGLIENQRVSIIEIDYQQDTTQEIFANQDVCIHLIGVLGKFGIKEEVYENINVELTLKILKWCEKYDVKQFIFCSTPGVQGFGHRLAVEEEKYAPRNYYEKTKARAEKEIKDFCKDKKIQYTIIRPDFVYGPSDTRRVKMYRNIKYSKFVLTTNGKSYLHPTYILDVVQGIIKTIANANAYNQIFNISAYDDVTSLEYLNTIAECVNSKLIHINIGYRISILLALIVQFVCEKILRRDAFVSKNKIDFLAINHSTSSAKARQMIGYEPQYNIQQGMQKTIDWCMENNLL